MAAGIPEINLLFECSFDVVLSFPNIWTFTHFQRIYWPWLIYYFLLHLIQLIKLQKETM